MNQYRDWKYFFLARDYSRDASTLVFPIALNCYSIQSGGSADLPGRCVNNPWTGA
jgi:hypothetical protein